MRRVVVVGGGIAGLAVAHALGRSTARAAASHGSDGNDRSAESACEVRLLEASDRLGGNIWTTHVDGFVIDAGPDSWLAAKGAAADLTREVGLEGDLIGTRPETRSVHIVWRGRLHAMPEGLVMGIPTRWRPFLDTNLLSLDGKLRAGLDWLIPKKVYAADEDESVAAMVTRRLGPEISERIVSPLLGGIFAGDANALSARVCIPQLVEAEQKYGSLLVAMREVGRQRRAQPGGGSTFLSLREGLGQLVDRLAENLYGARVTFGARVRGLAMLGAGDVRGRWTVPMSEGEILFADDVVLAAPAFASANIVRSVDADVAGALDRLPFTSTATVFLAYREDDVPHALNSVGFLVPRAEGRPILACTFVSSKWEGRAPKGYALWRVFVGGAGNESRLGCDDSVLERLAREQLAQLMGVTQPPCFAKVFRFMNASPQPPPGHAANMDRMFRRLDRYPGLYIAGNGLSGTGIPVAIAQGQAIAERILSTASS